MTKKVIEFEPFKNSKKWDEEYPNFLSYIEKYFTKDKDPNKRIDAEFLCKSLYFTIRFLEGTVNAFMILIMFNIPIGEFKRGKEYLINWLEDILNKLKEY